MRISGKRRKKTKTLFELFFFSIPCVSVLKKPQNPFPLKHSHDPRFRTTMKLSLSLTHTHTHTPRSSRVRRLLRIYGHAPQRCASSGDPRVPRMYSRAESDRTTKVARNRRSRSPCSASSDRRKPQTIASGTMSRNGRSFPRAPMDVENRQGASAISVHRALSSRKHAMTACRRSQAKIADRLISTPFKTTITSPSMLTAQ
mmetsp:Transcript_15357/g.35592  ORF Transcript_15357/g.35592 Transcript_15357/m.35592 type:complete len:201 (+) Transcript_15357:148-750(+)